MQVSVQETVEAKKVKILPDEAWELLCSEREVVAVKGKKRSDFVMPADKESVMAVALGPSGTLRAPTLKAGDRFIIGFDEELYRTLLT